MCALIIPRKINVTIARDEDDLACRKKKCAAFRSRLRALHISAKTFAELTGYSIETVYNWQSRTARCIPPAPMALRFLSLIERDRNVIKTFEEIGREGSY